MHIQKKPARIINTILLGILAVIWILPVFFVITNLFKTRQEYNLGSFWAWPTSNMFMANYHQLLNGMPIFTSMLNGLLYSLCGACLSVIIGVLAGYGIANLKIRHKAFWFFFIYAGNIFPFQLYLIPTYKMYLTTGLYDSRLGLILFYTAICIPFVMFVMRNNFLSINKEICESAKIEGATDFQVLCKLLLPMTQSAMAVIFLTQFSWCWNDLLFGLTLIKSETIQTIMPLISMMDKANAPVVFMVCIIVSIPTLFMFFLLQKNTETGLVYTSK
ncbi:MAG: carbohydrate ABC transporter permease [Sphaerochaetaceae bacterium]|nr:carbohydrate ABC transporter permease [Sphaerochaetaceae bacterium]